MLIIFQILKKPTTKIRNLDAFSSRHLSKIIYKNCYKKAYYVISQSATILLSHKKYSKVSIENEYVVTQQNGEYDCKKIT